MTDESPSLTLYYTAHIAGRLDLLPRLFTLIKAQREQAAGPALLLDLGGTCDPAAWECTATEGRAVLSVLDAMGYGGAWVDTAPMTPAVLDRLRQGVSMVLCGPGLPDPVPCKVGEWQVACLPAGRLAPDGVAMGVTVGDAVHWDASRRVLTLPVEKRTPAPGLMLGRLGIKQDSSGKGALCPAGDAERIPLPADIPPDAVIAAAVAFVRDEARLYRQANS